MTSIKAKKNLGQHFLKDNSIAGKIVDSLPQSQAQDILEIGPGMGVLTRFLLQNEQFRTTVIEIDRESVDYLREHFPQLGNRIISGNFLKMKPEDYFPGTFFVIGNLPYNISSQIFFRILELRDKIPVVVCMIQKEVAERISAGPGSKTYGILSVFLQAYYKIEYLFTVNEQVFIPPPKVKSGVIRLSRNEREKLDCDEPFFFRIVKVSFNQRRKTLRNSLKSFIRDGQVKDLDLLSKRPEQLGVDEFVFLTNLIAEQNPLNEA